MFITWQCQQCGWANDNINGACRRCGGDEDAKGWIKVKADRTKMAEFDVALKAKQAVRNVQNGGAYDRR